MQSNRHYRVCSWSFPTDVNPGIVSQPYLESYGNILGQERDDQKQVEELKSDIAALNLIYTKNTLNTNTSDAPKNHKNDSKQVEEVKAHTAPLNVNYTKNTSNTNTSDAPENHKNAINSLQETFSVSKLKGKRKKHTGDKNVTIFDAGTVKGHRSDIIGDVDELTEFINGPKQCKTVTKNKKSKRKQRPVG